MGKKKQKNKQKQKQKQKKVTQRQQKQAQRKQAQKQKRQYTAHQKQAERERLIFARQQEMQAKGLSPNRVKKKKNENRQQLEKRFRELTDKANDILDKFDDEQRMYVLDDDYGALFNDNTIMTNKGKFRKNPSELTNEDLKERIKILDTFIEDAPEYEKDAEGFENFAEEFFYGFNSKEDFENYRDDLFDKNKNKENYDALWDFINWVKSICGISVSSPQLMKIMDTVKSRFARGDNWSEIRKTFIHDWNAYDDWDSFIDNFSEQGVLL